MNGRRACAAWASLAAALALAGQFITVQFNYGGNWTGLFCTGSRFPVPAALAHESIYVFPDSRGYDGQFYHYIAHDPWLRHGLASSLDAPRLRYRRILIPALAWLLSGGGGRHLHAAYIWLILASVFLGAYWLGRGFAERGAHPAWGLLFLAIPGTLISLDRMTLDGPLAALTAAFALYVRAGPRWKLYLTLAAAPLVRETGLLLIAACGLWEIRRRQWARTLAAAATAAPALAWYAFVHARTADTAPFLLTLPLAGLFQRLSASAGYRLAAPVSRLAATLDWVAIAGLLVSLGLAVRILLRRRDALGLAVALFGLLLTTLKVHFWLDAYSYTRLVSPLLVLLLAAEQTARPRLALLPPALMLPRIGLQLGWQLLGVLRRLAG
jgi:hypothetical protein